MFALAEPPNPKVPLFSPHAPHPRQGVFLGLTVKEAMYGGAAGGGKSDAILMGALQYVDVPRYSALILRKSYADLSLPDAIMARAKEWLVGKPGVRWNEGLKSFVFSTGEHTAPARLTFGFLEGENDKYRYQGSAYQYVGFDELTQFRQSDYTYLFSRLRRPNDLDGTDPLATVPLRMRAASNPGGVGHDWVKLRFLIDGPGKGRIFVPARLADNPSLDAEEYEKALDELDDVTRAQLLYGDWDVRPAGDIFKPGAFTRFVEPEDVTYAGWRLVRRWDLAATKPTTKKNRDPDYTVGILMGRSTETGLTCIFDVKRFRERPEEVERIIAATAAQDGRNVRITMEQEPGSSGVAHADHIGRKVLYGYNFEAIRTTGDKVVNVQAFASAANRGQVLLVRAPWNAAYISECEAFPDGAHDDQADASGHAFQDLASLYQPGGATVQPTSKSYQQGRQAAAAYQSRRRPSLLNPGGRR